MHLWNAHITRKTRISSEAHGKLKVMFLIPENFSFRECARKACQEDLDMITSSHSRFIRFPTSGQHSRDVSDFQPEGSIRAIYQIYDQKATFARCIIFPTRRQQSRDVAIFDQTAWNFYESD